jgi:hypothetical protein
MCNLILSAFSRLRGAHSASVPEDFEFAVWIDFRCKDQDTLGATFASVRHKLEREREKESIESALHGVSLAVHNVFPKEIIRPSIVSRVTLAIRQCDLFLIPVVDPDYLKWSRPMMVAATNGQDSSINCFKNGQLEAFESPGWLGYLERATCRSEMMRAATYPVNNCEERVSLFRGSIQTALSNGLRPSVMYTDWFMAQDGKSAEFLPPLKHDFFGRYPPEDGKIFDEENRSLVREFTRQAREEWSLVTRGPLLHHTGPTAVDRAGAEDGGGGGSV